MTSAAPDWTPVASKDASASLATRTDCGAASRNFRTLPAGSSSYVWFKNALVALQKRPFGEFSTLPLVWPLIALTIGGVAYGLLDLGP